LIKDPLKHIDPMGALMLFIFGFGWAKPVPVNFSRLRDSRMGMIRSTNCCCPDVSSRSGCVWNQRGMN
jgi:hypothetical protein